VALAMGRTEEEEEEEYFHPHFSTSNHLNPRPFIKRTMHFLQLALFQK